MRNDVWLMANAFLICGIFWFFAFFLTDTVLVFDAVGYEDLGLGIINNGVFSYFSGLKREIMFPLRVSWAMNIADVIGVSYLLINKILGLISLLIVQSVVLYFLNQCHVSRIIKFVTIIWIGVAPSSIKMAFEMFSEGFACLLVTLMIFAFYQLFKRFKEENVSWRSILIWSFLAGLMLVIVTLIKAIFEGVAILAALFGLLILLSCVMRRTDRWRRLIVVFSLVFGVYFLSIHTYKSLNKVNNGEYAITGRSSWMFYGATALRTLPITAKEWEVGIKSSFLGHVYRCPYSYEECDFWSFWYSDRLGRDRFGELHSDGLSESEIKRQLYKEAFIKIGQKPIQFLGVLLYNFISKLGGSWLEVQFVAYPDWLDYWYYKVEVLNWPRLILRMLTLAAVGWASFYLLFSKKIKIIDQDPKKLFLQIALFFIFSHHLLYSFGPSLERYLLPFYAVNVVLIALMFNEVFKTKCYEIR